MPPHVRDMLRALGRAARLPQWRVLQDAIASYVAARPDEEFAPDQPEPAEGPVYDEEEEAIVMKRLHALGYLE